ncbi:MAG: WG repeat-containing protein, partial [Saprospiraceae bacterium]
GYMDMEGRLVIPYRYDLIGEVLEIEGLQENSRGLRLVQIGEGVGLMDNYRNELLPPIYEGVFPLTENLFAVKSGGLFYLRREGENRPVSEEETGYPSLRYLGRTGGGQIYLEFRRAGRRGVVDQDGREVVPAHYAQLRAWPDAPGYFGVAEQQNNRLRWGIHQAGAAEPLFAPVHTRVEAVHPDLFLLYEQTGNPPRAVDRNDQPHFGTDSLMRIDYLNQHWVEVVNYLNPGAEIVREGRHRVYSPVRHAWYEGAGRRFERVDSAYVSGRAAQTCLIDSTGTDVWTTPFINIRPYPWPNLYLVTNFGRHGLIDPRFPERGTAVIYDSIGPPREGLAPVYRRSPLNRSDLLAGLLNERLEQIVAPEYDRITYTDNKVTVQRSLQLQQVLDSLALALIDSAQARLGLAPRFIRNGERQRWGGSSTETRLLTLDDSLRVAEVASFGNVRSLRVRGEYRGEYRDAEELSYQGGDLIDIQQWIDGNRGIPVPRNATLRLDYAGRNRYGGDLTYLRSLTGDWKDERLLQPALNVNSVSPRPTTIFHGEGSIHSGLSRLLSRGTSLHPAYLYRHDLGRLEEIPDLVGARLHDRERRSQVMAVLAADGRFRLVDTSGSLVRSADTIFSCTYLGEFIGGEARFCTGGELVATETAEERRREVISGHELARRFNVFPAAELGAAPPSLTVRDLPGDSTRWGIISTSGRVLVPPTYDYLDDGIGGQFVAVRRGNYGVITPRDSVIVPLQYPYVSHYRGYWRVNVAADGPIYYDRRGYELIGSNYTERGEFRNDRCPVRDQTGRWGYVDGDGRLAIPCRYAVARDFGSGLAAVAVDSSHWRLIDAAGNTVTDLAGAGVRDAGIVIEGRCWFANASGGYGYLDGAGRVVVEPTFQRTFDFSGGRARAVADQTTGLIDMAGNWVLPPGEFLRIEDFDP